MKRLFIFFIGIILVACSNAPQGEISDKPPLTTEEYIESTTEEIEITETTNEESQNEEDEKTDVIEYRGALDAIKALGGIHHVGDGMFIDPAAMGLYTFTYTYDEDGEVFVYYPKRENTHLAIYSLVYDAKNGALVKKEFPMFEHTMKRDEVFVILYAFRDEPKIEIVFTKGDETTSWRPMDMENLNLPEEIGELNP